MSKDGTNGDFEPSKLDPALLATLPALLPPYGVESNFNNPPSIAYQFRVVTYTLLPIMLCHVLLRFYTRLRVKNSLGIDDYACVLSALIIVGYCAMLLHVMGDPLGPHQWNVKLMALGGTFGMLCTVQFIMYSFAATFVKLSILFLYRRLFWVRDSTRYMIWIGAITITLFYMASSMTSMVYCIPHNGEDWVSQSAIKRCAQPCLRISVAQGLFGIISDFYLLVIPMLRVSMLRITIWRKVGLAGIFLTGLLTCILSVTLCVYRFILRESVDFTYTIVPVFTFTVAELIMGVICSCIPVIYVVVKEHSKKIMSMIKEVSSGSKVDPIPTGEARSDAEAARINPVRSLPPVPKAHLSTLMSFIRNERRDNTENALLRNEDLVLTNVSDFDPRKDDYHAHI